MPLLALVRISRWCWIYGALLGYRDRFKPVLRLLWFVKSIEFLPVCVNVPKLPVPIDAHFSNCWCWLRIANLFTCTGIGTTILVWTFCESLLPFAWLLDVSPALTRFHFARRFWNQIFTWKIALKKHYGTVFNVGQLYRVGT